jgi:formylglycine-generating enzyme required for sulfatase activity
MRYVAIMVTSARFLHEGSAKDLNYMTNRFTFVLILLLLTSSLGLSPLPSQTESAPQNAQPKHTPGEIIAGMINIPAGEFFMGCDRSKPKEKCSLVEQPLHKVFLNDYYIDRTEVTVANYKACMAAGECNEPIRTYSDDHEDYFYNPAFDNYPVIFVTWFQARDYCTWMGKRLPTEAEWEKAARGRNSTRIYPWGNSTPDCKKANIKVGRKQCVGDVQEVGSYPADTSPYGVVDLAGNVREWINDWYAPGFYRKSPYKNPTGPDKGMYVVMRGGRFDNVWTAARVASRKTIGPNDYGAGIGFRCAVTINP